MGIYRALSHTPLTHSKSGSYGTKSAGHCTILEQKLKAKQDISKHTKLFDTFVLEMESRTEIQTATEDLGVICAESSHDAFMSGLC